MFYCVHFHMCSYKTPSSSGLDLLYPSRGIFKHEFLQVTQSQYHFGVKANWMSSFPPDTCQRLEGISSPNSPAGPPRASRLRPAGRRLMTLCLPSNRLFDNKPASVSPRLRTTETTLHRVATGREECDATHKHS